MGQSNSKVWYWVGGIVVVLLVLYFVVGSGGGSPQFSGDTVRFGFIGALTGDAASIGEDTKIAVELARDEINAAGGIGGKQVEVIFEDGQCNPQAAANAGNKLINVDRVPFILGGLCSSETLAVAPLSESAKVLLFSYGSTNPTIADAGDYVFRNVPSDAFQGVFAAEYVKNQLGKGRIALLKCLSDWCVGVNDAFKEKFQELGGTIVAEESFQQDSRDLRSQLTKVKAADPELIYFVSYTEATIPGLRQARELGITAPFFGADAWSDPKIWQDLGSIGDGAMYVEPANKDLPESFVAEMNRRTGGAEINVYVPRAYDAMKLLAALIEQEGDDVTRVKDALYNVRDYQGIADNYSFDSKGEVIGAAYVLRRVEGGSATIVR